MAEPGGPAGGRGRGTARSPGPVALLLLLALAAPAPARDLLPRAEAVPGGIAVVALPVTGAESPVVTYAGDRVLVRREGRDRWTAIVGLGLSTKPGRHRLSVARAGAAPLPVEFEVRDKQYERQYITIENRRQVNPDAEDLERIRREGVEIREALGRWRDRGPEQLRLDLPVDGVISGRFGLRRFFNGQPRRPHRGLDIAAPKGTPIRAPLAARVIAAGSYFFNGNSVFLDHGQGLVTMYAHMDRIDVEPGQRVAAGETIGTVGMTGRATGPNLHWGVTLNRAMVDPHALLAGDR